VEEINILPEFKGQEEYGKAILSKLCLLARTAKIKSDYEGGYYSSDVHCDLDYDSDLEEKLNIKKRPSLEGPELKEGWVFSFAILPTLYVLPPFSSDREREREIEIAVSKAQALYRSVGFRRVGDSGYFCLALNPEHLSHSLAKDKDYDPPELNVLGNLGEMLEEKRTILKSFGVSQDVSHLFQGYPPKIVKKCLETWGIPQPWSSEVMERTKYGCMCGKCIHGFLSPHTILSMEAACDRVLMDRDWQQLGNCSVDTLAIVEIIRDLAYCRIAPMVENVKSAYKGDLGPRELIVQINRALRVMEQCMRVCDKLFASEDYQQDILEGYDTSKLSRCRNDREWDFVVAMLVNDGMLGGI